MVTLPHGDGHVLVTDNFHQLLHGVLQFDAAFSAPSPFHQCHHKYP